MKTKVAVLESQMNSSQKTLLTSDADKNWGTQGDYDVKAAQAATAKLVFKAADENKNGKLSLAEITKFLNDEEHSDVKELLETAAGDKAISKQFAKAKAEDPDREMDEKAFVDFYVARCQ